MAKTSDILDAIRETGAKFVEFRYADIGGTWVRTTLPAASVDEPLLAQGIALGGGLLLRPDRATARLDEFHNYPTLGVICEAYDPATKGASERDARAIARRAEAFLKSTGIADTALFGADVDFFIFDSIAYEYRAHQTGYAIDSSEGPWNAGDAGLGVPADAGANVRSEIALELAARQIDVVSHAHGPSIAGHATVGLANVALCRSADDVMALKYVAKRTAARNGKTATFMPHPLFGERGSSLRVRQALWKDGKPLFYDAGGYAGCSQTMLYYIGGLLAHADSLRAFAAPTTNSYRRVASDRSASSIAFSTRGEAAAVRIAATEPATAKAQRVEFRAADPAANPYLTFAALLCAGIDGIRRRIDPVRAGYGPLDASNAGRPIATSLAASLGALAADRDYLTGGGVFGDSFLAAYTERAMLAHVDAVAARPHPYEFELSYDV